jgi:hypothetical protein
MTVTSRERATLAHGDDAANAALGRAVDHLRGLQHTDGWWKGELETNVTMDAEDLLLREFLGIRTEAETEEAARWIRSQQREDGTWANFFGGPAELSTTVEAYVALRLAGDSPNTPRLQRNSGSSPTAGSRARESSPECGWGCSAPGPGTTCRTCRPRSSTCRSGFPSTSMTGAAGRGRPSFP